MSAADPTPSETYTLQKFYLASRSLLKCGVVPAVCVQRSFEEAIAGFQAEDVWRPTHISHKAVHEALTGSPRNLQRAHGVVGDRMDRYDRTLAVLTGKEQSFEVWWKFWRHHDSTVLITKAEHGSNVRYNYTDLIEIPKDPADMFVRAGFSFKMRKKVEIAWLNKVRSMLNTAA